MIKGVDFSQRAENPQKDFFVERVSQHVLGCDLVFRSNNCRKSRNKMIRIDIKGYYCIEMQMTIRSE